MKFPCFQNFPGTFPYFLEKPAALRQHSTWAAELFSTIVRLRPSVRPASAAAGFFLLPPPPPPRRHCCTRAKRSTSVGRSAARSLVAPASSLAAAAAAAARQVKARSCSDLRHADPLLFHVRRSGRAAAASCRHALFVVCMQEGGGEEGEEDYLPFSGSTHFAVKKISGRSNFAVKEETAGQAVCGCDELLTSNRRGESAKLENCRKWCKAAGEAVSGAAAALAVIRRVGAVSATALEETLNHFLRRRRHHQLVSCKKRFGLVMRVGGMCEFRAGKGPTTTHLRC